MGDVTSPDGGREAQSRGSGRQAVLSPCGSFEFEAKAYANLDTALEAAGVGRRDVVKVTTFVVGCEHEEKWPVIRHAHQAFFGDAAPAWTVVGVEALARPGLSIEIEATAAQD